MEEDAARTGEVPEVRLEDYAPPPFLVDAIDLEFELAADESRVTSRLSVRRAPETPPEVPLVLDGSDLELGGVALNGRMLSANEYALEEHRLVIPASVIESGGGRNDAADAKPDPLTPFEITVRTRIFPVRNSTLKGLYASNGILCTQCEAEDFRRITFFPDRPDVLARYTTTIRASQADFPVLLSNGNLVAGGTLEDGRHWVRWKDPFPKPSYLFALVAGDLACLEDRFTTASGREVELRIYADGPNIGQCRHAMASLEKAMRWDETAYGLEYDLDLYMIVAVDDFTMGAMENKGLNVFNTPYVLADPETATDADFDNVEAVIGHEYFHNWTGNRVTCRDWFQLSLKEGLTVFREQQFSADSGSRAVKRIRDARFIRDRQFREDGGPDAHPVRPSAYKEINNFYTTTVYHKGAEVIRMMHTLLGPEAFRRGMDIYLARHDGSAATTDDFVSAMEDGGGVELGQFRRWYSQAGTPVLHLEDEYDPKERRVSLRVRQELHPTADGSAKEPMHLPLAIGLVGRDGRPLAFEAPGGGEPDEDGTVMLDVRAPEQAFVFRGCRRAAAPLGVARVLGAGEDRDAALRRRVCSPARPRPRSLRTLGRGPDARSLPARSPDRGRRPASSGERGGRPGIRRSRPHDAPRPLHRRSARRGDPDPAVGTLSRRPHGENRRRRHSWSAALPAARARRSAAAGPRGSPAAALDATALPVRLRGDGPTGPRERLPRLSRGHRDLRGSACVPGPVPHGRQHDRLDGRAPVPRGHRLRGT